MKATTPKEDEMGKRGPKGFTDTKIVTVLRAVEAAVAQGDTVKEAVLAQDVSIQTYSKWKKTYGSMDKNEVKRLRELEKENARLKKLLAEANLDKDILREALEGKY